MSESPKGRTGMNRRVFARVMLLALLALVAAAFNELFLAEISAKFNCDLTCWKNHPAYEELRTYGALAA